MLKDETKSFEYLGTIYTLLDHGATTSEEAEADCVNEGVGHLVILDDSWEKKGIQSGLEAIADGGSQMSFRIGGSTDRGLSKSVFMPSYIPDNSGILTHWLLPEICPL